MADYVLIESRPDAGDIELCCDVGARLVTAGSSVKLFLVQNGVLAARRGAKANGLDGAAASGIEVLADDFSLRERGIDGSALRAEVAPAPLETVVDALVRGAKVVWR